MKYNKLVRDRIPEIIAESGKTAVCITLNENEFAEYLEKKLDEEVAELHECKTNEERIDELVDIEHTLYAIMRVYGIGWGDYIDASVKKVEERGAFNNKLCLLEVLDDTEEVQEDTENE